MKLNNSQINALAEKIHNQIDTEIKKSKVTLENFQTFFNSQQAKEYKEVKKFLSNKSFTLIDKMRGLKESRTSSDLLNSVNCKFVNDMNSSKNYKYITLKDVKNAIVLKTIECKDLDSIIDSVKKEFLK